MTGTLSETQEEKEARERYEAASKKYLADDAGNTNNWNAFIKAQKKYIDIRIALFKAHSA